MSAHVQFCSSPDGGVLKELKEEFQDSHNLNKFEGDSFSCASYGKFKKVSPSSSSHVTGTAERFVCLLLLKLQEVCACRRTRTQTVAS